MTTQRPSSSGSRQGRVTRALVINHTHWDREWFLTHEYTTAWVPPLIDALTELAESNNEYEFLLDGQTLVIEDLLKTRPDYLEKVEELIAKRTLHIGPIYSQPDWRLVSGQLHVRNLLFGTSDAARFGGSADVAWLVDTFGHISQTPQLLSLAGIDAAYVWRGVPEMHPVFQWGSGNGSHVTTVNLFGGYRNLYGVTKTPDIALDRLVAETDKLAPYYGEVPIPLFDGYDLDTEPEDPARYYEAIGLPPGLELRASSPRSYVDTLLEETAEAGGGHGQVSGHPVLEGELLSGRYGSVFPGTLSGRTYLKILHHDAEVALQLRAEPLAVLAGVRGRKYPAELFEQVSRELLQNGVHDCICGVSVDQVHERMDRSYRQLIAACNADAQQSIDTVLADFAPGTYAVSTSAMANTTVQRIGPRAVIATTSGIGVQPVVTSHPIELAEEPMPEFVWDNGHYSASFDDVGLLLDGRRTAQLIVRSDVGDTYSSEPGEVLGEGQLVAPPVVESRSAVDAVVRLDVEFRSDVIVVSACLRIRFDETEVVHLTIDLDSTGTAFRVDLDVESGVVGSTVLAGMPFDLVERAHHDEDLLPVELAPDLSGVLMGQREVGRVDEFPFQGFVAHRGADRSVAVLSQGLRSYGSDSNGRLSVALRRSVEQLASSGLAHRQGDAGPAMYVPGARCERVVRHEVGVATLTGSVSASELYRINEAFQSPPLIVESNGAGELTEWNVFAEDLPMGGLELVGEQPVMRLFNPEVAPVPLSQERRRVSWRGVDRGTTTEIGAKEILSLAIDVRTDVTGGALAGVAPVDVHGLPQVRVGPSRSLPDPKILELLDERQQRLQAEALAVAEAAAEATGDEKYRLTHHEYVLAREQAELALSLELNRRRAASSEVVSLPDEADPDVARLGLHLNDLRVKRRIYDYVVQSL